MLCVRRLLPLALLTMVLVAGCQSSGVATNTRSTAQFQRDRDALNIELAATTRELNATQVELTGTLTDIITMRNAMNGYVHNLVDNGMARQEQERRMAEARAAYETGTLSNAEMTQTLREYIECLVKMGIEERTANEAMEQSHARVNERVAAQNQRLEEIVRRVSRLQAKVDSLQQQLNATN